MPERNPPCLVASFQTFCFLCSLSAAHHFCICGWRQYILLLYSVSFTFFLNSSLSLDELHNLMLVFSSFFGISIRIFLFVLLPVHSICERKKKRKVFSFFNELTFVAQWTLETSRTKEYLSHLHVCPARSRYPY